MIDSDTSVLSSYSSDSEFEAFEFEVNVSNDAKPNAYRESMALKSPNKSKLPEEPALPLTTIKIDSQLIVEADALAVRLSPDKSAVAVGLSNGVIKVFFLDKLADEGSFVTLSRPEEKQSCNDLRFVDGTKKIFSRHYQDVLAVYSSGFIRLWNCFNRGSQPVLVFEIFEVAIPCDFNNVSEDSNSPNELLCVSLSMDSMRFVTGGYDTIIKVYDMTTKTRLLDMKSGPRNFLTKECSHHTNRVSAVVYHPRGATDSLYKHIFVSAGWDQTIHIWDDRTATSLWRYFGPHVVGSDGLDIDSIQNSIVATSWIRSGVMLKVWKFADFAISRKSLTTKRKILQNYSKPVSEVATEGPEMSTQGYVASVGGEGRYVFYGGYGRNVLKVIDRESMTIVAGLNDLQHAVYSLDSCLDPKDKRRCLVAFTSSNSLYIASVQNRTTIADVPSL